MIKTFLGTNDLQQFLISIIYAIIGIAVLLLTNAANRKTENPTTPYVFSWSFLLGDNIKRIALDVLLIFIAVRFYGDIFGKPITPWLATLLGLGFDKIAQLIKDKTGMLQVDRTKLVDKETITTAPK